jgi:hypothetical protein
MNRITNGATLDVARMLVAWLLTLRCQLNESSKPTAIP